MVRRDREFKAVAPNRHLCLKCNYDLRGLPDDHFCPECGWHYTRLPCVWLKPRMWTIMSFIGITLFVGCLDPTKVVWLAWTAFAGWRCYRLLQRGEYVAILGDGIELRLSTVEPRHLRWDEIQELHAGQLDKSCLLVLREARNDEIVAGVFRSHEEVQEFVELGRQRREEAAY
ncbi:MAG: hypothetical protein IH895_05235 [Planctomycetes bacterium]|nr:hypothetical protein [Planctomycetota bacterium]